MAKKNSSKTATEKAIQSSEPKVMTYRAWKGVNYVDSPLTWDPLEIGPNKFRQSDLPSNYLMVQNNLITTPTLGIETRPDSIVIGELPDEIPQWVTYNKNASYFTGIACVYYRYLFAVIHWNTGNNSFVEFIVFRDLLDQDVKSWSPIYLSDGFAQAPRSNIEICEIGFFENNMVVTARTQNETGTLYLGSVSWSGPSGSLQNIAISGTNWTTGNPTGIPGAVVNTPHIQDPNVSEESDLAHKDWPCTWAEGMEYKYVAHLYNDSTDPNHEEEIHPDAVVRLDIVCCYTNRLGSTLASYPTTIYVEYSPALWSSGRYVTIHSRGINTSIPDQDRKKYDYIWNNLYDDTTGYNFPVDGRIKRFNEADPLVTRGSGITGVDLYAREMENTDYVFIGHVDIDYSDSNKVTLDNVDYYSWKYNWLGNMTDTTQWQNSQLQLPTENTTEGPNVTHFSSHDSRMYYWGQPDKPYRLYIGGNPGAEFSIARGLGGAWIDIEPGSGFEVAGTAKWKTSQGANIVTILCGNRNTNKVRRFNLVETALTFTNEISYKSYMYEEVSNVVGCNSRYGYGVFDDGLYCLSRYGLMLTTMAMEYNNQMKTQDVSALVKPIFTERLGDRLRDGRMVCIDSVIYIALSEDTVEQTPINLDNVILCYDIELQAWYTFTHDQVYGRGKGEDPDKIHHILAVDSDQFIEGLGAITDTQVRLYPTTGIQDAVVPEFQVIIESGELIPKMPKQVFDWIEQLEFRFDYFVGDPDDPATILIEGVDYYGRSFEITKKLNIKSRGYHGLEGEQRSYIEWVRVNKLVESMRIRIKGKARFRLTHIVNKMYTQSDRIGTPYGYDANDAYYNRHQGKTKIHHYINDYNNLRDAVVS